VCRLLLRHRNLEPLFRRDQVVVIVLLQVDLHPVDLTTKLVIARAVIRRDRGALILADVAGLIGGENHRYRHVDAALAVLLAVYIERDRAPLRQAAAVVLELHTHLVLAGGDRLGAFGEGQFDAQEVVAMLELAVLGVQAPAIRAATLGDDDALGARFGNLEFSGHRIRLVLHNHDRVLGNAAHTAEQDLGIAFDELRPAAKR